MALTKLADKVICCIYKEFLERRKNGESLSDSGHFESDFYTSIPFLSKMQESDIDTVLQELRKNGYIKLSIIGSFRLTDDGLIYMENRFGDKAETVLEWINKIVGAVPFI